VKVPVHPAALKVQVSWTMIKMFNESTDVDFEFQRTKVNKLLLLVQQTLWIERQSPCM
jgi:hypothetical protein